MMCPGDFQKGEQILSKGHTFEPGFKDPKKKEFKGQQKAYN